METLGGRVGQGKLFDDAGDEGLTGFGGGEGIEGELAAALCAELEEKAGSVRVVGVDRVDEAHPGSAVKVAFVGDGGERDL
jgi:hypothetical protein